MGQVITFPPLVTASRTVINPPTGRFALYHYRWRLRRMLERDLLNAPETMLQDAGMTRAQVRAAIAKPFWRA